ncbi:helix-turn-helix domain-containing protein [Peribacillus simplex]|uniref:DNA-binding protein n=1 Tax=Peribacillus simplex NBRC 15720 = DSM 1321 TaxID=1349754 RepID=A0A223EMZ5_9BACI|nr:helix-turn-helix domain-containing protein [Peribacillus simplex]ASS96627.1 DNA-binding protein [Peribacillus simplex NBRC 15720 = DSM 1321]MEC1395974.1 helix-turn-helix domain-containing protein [Peribacillus simplex]
MKEYTVKEVSYLLGKHEETIKRWIRSGKFPNSYRNSDKEGWKIIESDLLKLNNIVPINKNEQKDDDIKSDVDEIELVKLAYQAVTLTSPTDEMLSILSVVGIKRTLEILLIMQQSVSKVKNPDGFIRKAIRENWSPSTIPTNLPNNSGKRLYDLSQQEFDNNNNQLNKQQSATVPFYNWLEE